MAGGHNMRLMTFLGAEGTDDQEAQFRAQSQQFKVMRRLRRVGLSFRHQTKRTTRTEQAASR